MTKISAIIVDDEIQACRRLEMLLHSFTELEVAGVFTRSDKAIDYIIRKRPEIVFLDVEMENGISAFDIINTIHEKNSFPAIILVTAHPHYAIKAIRNEVLDYLLKPVDIDDLKSAIQRYFSRVNINTEIAINNLTCLSEREKEVLKHVLEGRSSREIAEKMYISINTVNTHRRNILKKTGCKSALELIRIKNF